ncbi:MAG: ACT domain-containing protein [Halobacteriota archaeon]|nr:ACT domain-containing protein [Halobacteriota archaeon]
MIKQISVFAENKPGVLAKVTNLLKDEGINIFALTIAETGEFGVVRFIADMPDRAYEILHVAGYTVSETDVLGVGMEDVPGSLARIAYLLGDEDINIEYCYAFTMKNWAILVLKVDDLERAASVLKSSGKKLLSVDDVYRR